jgi:O-antigen/teichoic acid export membrane protein
MSLKKLALKGFYWSLLDKVINQIGMFFVMVYLARLLGPETFGLIGMLAIFIAISQSLINSGFSQALIQRSKHVTSEDLSTVFVTNIAVALVLYALLYFSAPYIAGFYNEPTIVNVSRILFLVLLIDALSVVPRAVLSIRVDFKSQAIASFFSSLVGAVVAIFMANNGYSYWSLVGLTLTRAAIFAILLGLFTKWKPGFRFYKASFTRLFSFGSKLLVAGLVATTVQNLHALLIGQKFGAADVGYFTQAHNLTNILSSLISSAFQGVTYPIMTSVNDDIPRLVSIYERLIQLTVVVTIPFFVGFASISNEFVNVFLGESWRPTVPLIMILSFARMITPLSSINLNILNAVGRSDLFLKVDLLKLPVTLLAIFVAVPFGIIAVAWAMLATVVISFLINTYYPGKLFGFGASRQIRVCAKPICAALIMFGAVSIVDIADPLSMLVLKILVGVCVYSMVLAMMAPRIVKDIFLLFRG